MPQAMINAYTERLPARKAEWALLLIDAVALPHLKAEQQRQVIRRLERALQGHRPQGPAHPSDQDLRRMGIGVRYERKPR